MPRFLNWSKRIDPSKFRPVLDVVFPRFCVLCDRAITEPDVEAVCKDCLAKLVTDEQRCLRCSAPVRGKPLVHLKSCHLCKPHWQFKKVYSMCIYKGPAAKAARKMKNDRNESATLQLGLFFGEWLKANVDLDRFDFLIPIPQHWRRRITVRYNQAEILAMQISRVNPIPLRTDLLVRSRYTDKQGTKTIEERLVSVEDSFRAAKRSRDLEEANVLLIDDILTSGATANDAARALRAGGASSVDVACFARGASA